MKHNDSDNRSEACCLFCFLAFRVLVRLVRTQSGCIWKIMSGDMENA